MANPKGKNVIKELPKPRRCPDCGGRHPFYIKGCPLKSDTVRLRRENARLTKRCERLEGLEGLREEIYTTLDWMITTLEFQNKNTGMNAEDSLEMKAAKILRDKLKPKSD